MTRPRVYAVQAVVAFVTACITLVVLVFLAKKGINGESPGFVFIQLWAVAGFLLSLIAGVLYLQSSQE